MMGLLSNIGKGIAKVLDVTTVALAHPVKTATAIVSKKSTVQDVVTAHFAQPLKKQITDVVLGTAGIAATVAGGAVVGGAAKAGTLAPRAISIGKALIPATTKGKVIAAVAAPVVVGAVVKEPVAVAKTVSKAPSELAQFGGDVATFAASPSIDTGKQILKESPIISTIIGGAVVGGAAAKIIPAVATARQTEAIQEQTKAIEAATAQIPVESVVPKATTQTPQAPQTPITPETKPLIATAGSGGTSTSKRRKKRVSNAVAPSVRQSVAVVVQNKANSTGIRQTKRLIKREVLLN